jgi:hypothetical protein
MNQTVDAARGDINADTLYVLYLPKVEHLGVHKKKIWKLVERTSDREVTIKSITTNDMFRTKLENIVDIKVIAQQGYLSSQEIQNEALHEYKSIEAARILKEANKVQKMHTNYQNNFNTLGGQYADTTSKQPTGADMNTSISGTINKNTDAAKQAAIVVAGSTLNSLIASRMGKQLPRKYRKLANHPMANIVIANMASFAVQNFASDNNKAKIATEAMMQAAMQDFLQSFNIEQIIGEVLDSVNLNNLVED